jgi:hypothetical protein
MMRVGFAFVVVLAAVVGVQVQGGGGQGRGEGTAKTPDTFDPSKNHVLVGCLKQAPSGGFMLADAAELKPGTAASTSSMKKDYTLAGVIPPSLNLQPHLNHKVQLSGSITDGTKFNMEQFKMVSATCP